MDTGVFTKIAVGAVICLVVVTGIVTPLLLGISYTATEDNSPAYYATDRIEPGLYEITSNGFSHNGDTVQVATSEWIIISDSLLVIRYNSTMHIYDISQKTYVESSSITITGNRWSATSGDTTYTGSVGGHPVIRSNTGNIGVYSDQDFIIAKSSTLMFCDFNIANVTVGSDNFAVRAAVAGYPTDLKVIGLILEAGSRHRFLDTDTATVTINENYLAEYDIKNYTVGANPIFTLTFSYQTTEYTVSSEADKIAAPIEYLVQSTDEVQSMIGIVPLLMTVGIITALVGALIIRRT